LDLYHGRPSPITPYGIGVALEPGELIYRQIWTRYSTLGATPDLIDGRGQLRLGSPLWKNWGWCDAYYFPPALHPAPRRHRTARLQLVDGYWRRSSRPRTPNRRPGRPYERVAGRLRRAGRPDHRCSSDRRDPRSGGPS